MSGWIQDTVPFKYVPNWVIELDEPRLENGVLEYFDEEPEPVTIKLGDLSVDASTDTSNCVPG